MGTELVRRLIEIARDEKIQHVTAHTLSQNVSMLAMANYFHFEITGEVNSGSRVAILDLNATFSAA